MSAITLAAAQESFTRTLSAVEDAVRFAFRRRLRSADYEEVLAEAMAAAWSSWTGLLNKGKNPVEVGVHGIASNAVRYVRNGRKIGNRSGGRGAMDVFHRKAQAKCGFTLVSLGGAEADGGDSSRDSWRAWLAEDKRVGPADLACARLDFAAWLAGLPPRNRRVAELLAEGHEGVAVARLVGVTPGRVSQLRPALESSWGEFQAQAERASGAGPRPGPRGRGRNDAR